MTFLTQMEDVILVVEELGYPFLEMTADLCTLDIKVVMPFKVIQSVKSAEDIGKKTNIYYLLKRETITILQFSMTLSRKKNSLQLFI